MMTFLANIGSSTATIFKFIYLKFAIIKRKFRFKKIKSEHFLRSMSAENFENIYESNENLHKKEEEKPAAAAIVANLNNKLNRTGSNSKTDSRKSSMKLHFKTDEQGTETTDSKEKSLSNLKREYSESKKSVLVSARDVKFEPVTQLIVDDVNSETKLLDAAKRIENLIEINLENKFEQKEPEFLIGRDPDDLDEEYTFKTNQFLLPKIFE